MLRSTFLHLDGIGEKTEQKLWRSGIRNWDALLTSMERSSGRGRGGAGDALRESMRHYADARWSFFDQRIPGRHKWRAFGDLAPHALYVDIETTGMGSDDDITVIGTYDGRRFRAYVRNQDLQQAQEQLEAHPLIVTFNGACFDLPLIRARFPCILFNHVHIDLRYPLRALGHSGGLKHIEKRLGIKRSEDTEGLDGWDAVRLWHEHQRGSKEALDLLVRYNEEDVRNMEPLMKMVFSESLRRLGIGRPGEVSPGEASDARAPAGASGPS